METRDPTPQRTRELMNARVDGEIPPEDAAELDAYLTRHPEEAARLESLGDLDRGLRSAFGPHREAAAAVAERTVLALRARRRRVRPATLLALAAAAAAGFLAAALSGWESDGPAPPPAAPPVATLTLATGPVDVLRPGHASWTPLAVGEGVPAGAELRTDRGGRCELEGGDGSVVRLDRGSLVRFADLRRFELERGEMWSAVEPG
ncbi:MAG: hypothetical protein ACE5JG_07435, partial [Planctomycetota bacterium]